MSMRMEMLCIKQSALPWKFTAHILLPRSQKGESFFPSQAQNPTMSLCLRSLVLDSLLSHKKSFPLPPSHIVFECVQGKETATQANHYGLYGDEISAACHSTEPFQY